MKKKKIKLKLITCLSVIIISFLISASSFKAFGENASFVQEHNKYITDSFDGSTWNWSLTEVVSTESTSNSRIPSLTADSEGNVHVVWQDLTDYNSAGTDYDIFYKCWDNSVSSWTTTEVVSTESTSGSQDPSLAVDSDGNVHIAWYDNTDYAGSGTDWDIFYKHWNYSSSLWTTTEVVSTESTDQSGYPSLAVDAEGDVHIAWDDWTNYGGTDVDIFYKRRDASTTSWTTTEVVSTESTDYSAVPSLAVDVAGHAHITWYDFTDYAGAGADWDIFYKRLDASTTSWTTTEVVSTESSGRSEYPSLAVDATGDVHITWTDDGNYAGAGTDEDIFYKYWNNFTSLWTTTEVISTESTSFSQYPSLAVDVAGHAHITWYDWTNFAGAGTDHDIFYKHWDATASLWTITEVISTESTGDTLKPSITIDSDGHVHIAWDDATDYVGSGTDWDIVYKLLTGPPESSPELAFIVPNPNELASVNLDWNDVFRTINYYVYRSTSYIWSVESLNPIATVSTSDYVDTVPSEGFYYYAIVASNLAGNSSHSNCQYVEVKFPDLEAPELSPILPNPTELTSISLVWNDIDGATEYYVYRSTSYIWTVEGLTPVTTVVSPSFVDSLPSEDTYFYVIVAGDGLRNSTHSNCEYIEYKLPTLHEFIIISSLIIGIPIFLFAVTRIRKKIEG